MLATGPDFHFTTYPPPNSTRPFRFLAWGDSGTGDYLQGSVAATMNAHEPAHDFAIGLGDLVYEVGAWEEYDPRFFERFAPDGYSLGINVVLHAMSH